MKNIQLLIFGIFYVFLYGCNSDKLKKNVLSEESFSKIIFHHKEEGIPTHFSGKWYVRKKLNILNSDSFIEEITCKSLKNGQLDGYSYCWRKNLHQSVWILFWKKLYKKNELVDLEIYHLGTGRIWSKEHFSHGQKNGEAIYWNNSGEIVAKGIFENGKPFKGKFRIISYKNPLSNNPKAFQNYAEYSDGKLISASQKVPLLSE